MERKLNQQLISLTRDFTSKEFFEYRKERNWEKYNTSSSVERLIIILKEVKEFKNGYIEDENNENY